MNIGKAYFLYIRNPPEISVLPTQNLQRSTGLNMKRSPLNYKNNPSQLPTKKVLPDKHCQTALPNQTKSLWT